jgi:vacuolar protein sorting-associated protein 45
MDISQAVSGYITKMVSTGDAVQSQAAAKMKILLLDNETVRSFTTFVSHIAFLTNTSLGAHRLVGHHPVRPAEPQCLPHRSP